MSDTLFIAGPVSFPFPQQGDAEFTGEVEAYQILATNNIHAITVDGHVVDEDTGLFRGMLVNAGNNVTITPNDGGGSLVYRRLYARPPTLGDIPVSPELTAGALNGPAALLSGAQTCVLTLRPRASVSATTDHPDIRLAILGDLPDDTVIDVTRYGSAVATLTVQDQYTTGSGSRAAVFRGPYSLPWAAFQQHDLILHRTGGGLLPDLPGVSRTLTGEYGWVGGGPLNIFLDAVQVDTGGGLADSDVAPAFAYGIFPPRAGALRGPTARRPTVDIGSLPWIDTDLDRPIWRLADGTWIDAAGTPV